jgi:hypothetical protein
MRVDAQVIERDPGVARARMIGAMTVGVLLMAGCGTVTVVSEEAPSYYALCNEKREAGGVTPELAALDCAELAERAGTENV